MFMRISTWDGDHQQRWAKSYDRPGACLNRPRLPTPFRRVVDPCVDDLSRRLRGKYLQDGGVYRPDADPAENFPLCFDSVREFAKPKYGINLLKLETLPRRPDHPARCGPKEFSGNALRFRRACERKA
jgi:hypothetical protein